VCGAGGGVVRRHPAHYLNENKNPMIIFPFPPGASMTLASAPDVNQYERTSPADAEESAEKNTRILCATQTD